MLNIGDGLVIVENRWDPDVSSGVSGIPPFTIPEPYSCQLEALARTVLGCQFGWGSRLLKSNAGVQRSAWSGWKSGCKCKGIRRLNCETDRSSSPNFVLSLPIG